MEACIIICKNRKEDSHKGKVIFIDAKGEVSRKNAESYLENTHIQKIISAYENFEDIEYFAKVADINDIDNNKSLLSIQSYVKQKEQMKYTFWMNHSQNGLRLQDQCISKLLIF